MTECVRGKFTIPVTFHISFVFLYPGACIFIVPIFFRFQVYNASTTSTFECRTDGPGKKRGYSSPGNKNLVTIEQIQPVPLSLGI